MTSFCTEKITTDVELDDTDLTVDQLTKVDRHIVHEILLVPPKCESIVQKNIVLFPY
jgi:hypothetical protein